MPWALGKAGGSVTVFGFEHVLRVRRIILNVPATRAEVFITQLAFHAREVALQVELQVASRQVIDQIDHVLIGEGRNSVEAHGQVGRRILHLVQLHDDFA